MLEIRLNCEHCNKSLPPDSLDARICTYECTFCASCVETILFNVCPNCGGGFEKRPIRPKKQLLKHPPRTDSVYKSVDMDAFKLLLDKTKDIAPNKR